MNNTKIVNHFRESVHRFCVSRLVELGVEISEELKQFTDHNWLLAFQTWYFQTACKESLALGIYPIDSSTDFYNGVVVPVLNELNSNLTEKNYRNIHLRFVQDINVCNKEKTKENVDELFPDQKHELTQDIFEIILQLIMDEMKNGSMKQGDVVYTIIKQIYHYGGGARNLKFNDKYQEYHMDTMNCMCTAGMNKLILQIHARNGDWYGKPKSMCYNIYIIYILSLHSIIYI